MDGSFASNGVLWRHDSATAWHFLTVPAETSSEIHERFGMLSPGFGSLRVEATIGDTRWRTSIFYDRSLRSYLLPVNAAARKAGGLAEGDRVDFVLRVL